MQRYRYTKRKEGNKREADGEEEKGRAVFPGTEKRPLCETERERERLIHVIRLIEPEDSVHYGKKSFSYLIKV